MSNNHTPNCDSTVVGHGCPGCIEEAVETSIRTERIIANLSFHDRGAGAPTTEAGRKLVDAEMPWHSEDCEFRSDSDSPCDCGLEHFVTRAEAEAARKEHDQHLAVQVKQAEAVVSLRAALQRCDNPLHVPKVHSPKHCLDGRCGTCRSMAECPICALLWSQFVAGVRAALEVTK